MSAEYYDEPTPENNKPVETNESSREIEELLCSLYPEKRVQKDSPLKIDRYNPNKPHDVMAGCENGDIQQILLATIKAGREFFNIIDATTLDSGGNVVNMVTVTRHIQGQRAEMIGVIDDGKMLNIGRSEQGYLDNSVSHKQCSINLLPNGTIEVTDNGSTNGTEIFTNNPDYPHTEKNNPVANIEFWSAKSATVKDCLLGREETRTARPGQ